MQRKSTEFKQVLSSLNSLKSALTSDPFLLQAYDENQQTFLHHFVQESVHHDFGLVIDQRELLRNVTQFDFATKDKMQNTPLHTAAWHGGVDNIASLLFPFLLKKAEEQHFDFSMQGEFGLTVLHVAAKIRAGGDPEHNNIKAILDNVKDPALNVFSQEGASAFYYALASENFVEARALLAAGANPLLASSPEFHPIQFIANRIDELSDVTNLADYPDLMRKNFEICAEFRNLFQALRLNNWVLDHAEIRKNARILNQATRSPGLFAMVPDQILVKVAAHTTQHDNYELDAAEVIAQKYCARPL